jgi:hypothetical protein
MIPPKYFLLKIKENPRIKNDKANPCLMILICINIAYGKETIIHAV